MVIMIRNPSQWTVYDVIQWVHQINFPQAEEMIKYHNIDGKDLIQLNDADLRFDFKMKQIHERKYLLRNIQQLRNAHSAIIDVEYKHDVCSIRVHDIQTYTFSHLREDSYRFFGLPAEKVVLRDKDGLIWGGVSVSCIFDNEMRQQEPVYLAVIEDDVFSDTESLKNDEEIFNKIQNITDCIGQLDSQILSFATSLPQ